MHCGLLLYIIKGEKKDLHNTLDFRKGFKDGIPIALGYFSVSFAFGMLAVSKGFPIWAPIMTSLTNFTGTGQFAGIDLISAGAGYAEIACTLLIINLRYMLMSLSLSQKLSDEITIPQRMVIAFGNTDEIYGVSMQQFGFLTYRYMLGIITCSFLGWVLGTALGSVASSILPVSVLSALGISLYAMFIAIIIPPSRESKPVLGIIICAAVFSCLFRYVPILSKISGGWVIIISGVISSAVFAMMFPAGKEEDNKNAE